MISLFDALKLPETPAMTPHFTRLLSWLALPFVLH